MQVRRFSPDLKTKVPGGHPGLYGVPIQIDRAEVPEQGMEELSRRLNGLPILLNRPMIVAALYLEAGGSMDEHSAEVPALFLVTRGRGFVRIGGSSGETRSVSAGDAVLWPAGLDHMVWSEDEPLEAIVIDGPAEREEA
jgi:quercetin dioxygenase-like cupin family protein